MDVQLLHTFVTVARKGNVSAAAAELHLSQATVSRQLQRLEAALGVELFVRREGRALELSDAGARALEASQSLVEDFGRGWAELRAVASEERRLVVGVGSFFSQIAAARRMFADFRGAHPDIELVVRENNDFAATRDELDAGDIDLAFTGLDERDNKAPREAMTLWPLGPRVVLSAQHPLAERETLTIADVTEEPFAFLGDSTAMQQFASACEGVGVVPDLRMRCTQVTTLASLVESGRYLTIVYGLPERAVAEPFSHLRSVPFEMPGPDYGMALFWRRDRKLGEMARAFVDHVAAAVDAARPVSQN